MYGTDFSSYTAKLVLRLHHVTDEDRCAVASHYIFFFFFLSINSCLKGFLIKY